MKLFKTALKAVLISSLIIVSSCKSNDDEDLMGNWVKLSPFQGVPRLGAVGFVIGETGYVGMGYNSALDDDEEYRTDFWRCTQGSDGYLSWTEVAPFPGKARYYATAFVVNDKAYVTTGYDGYERYKETWEYDPSTNVWTQKADFPGSARYDAVAFGIGDNGYVGTGYDGNNLMDFYKYTPSTDSWDPINAIKGDKRRGAAVFVLNNKAYVFNGRDNATYVDDVNMFDPETQDWVVKRSIKADGTDESYDDDYNITSAYNATFTKDGFGYVTTGVAGSVSNLTWQYDPVNDVWEELSAFEGASRRNAIGFTINNTPYVIGGYSGTTCLDDIWTFDPNAEQDDND